jgi:hypothetical protein
MFRKITRILSIAFILFISLFALDVFDQEQWLLALVMHLIPTYIAIILTVISWKKEVLGGVLWILLALIIKFTTGIDWVIIAPMIVIGGLNLVSGKKRN